MKIFITILFILIQTTLYASNFFEQCQRVFLNGQTLEEFKNQLTDENEKKELEKIQRSQDCFQLLNHAELGDNGLLLKRTLLASTILQSVVGLYRGWVTPDDLDRPPQCQDPYQEDLYDFNGPAYHFTRALFQKSRKASLSVTAYGDLRALTKGDNPTIGQKTSLKVEDIQNQFKLNGDFQYAGDGPLLGFLYQRRLTMKAPYLPLKGELTNSWKNELNTQSFKVFGHLGAGVLGNPVFLIKNAPLEAYNKNLIINDGTFKLPRKLAKAVLENLLCESLSQQTHEVEKQGPSGENHWNHPLANEKSCLQCHKGLDSLAAGLRHMTFIWSHNSCSKTSPQILIPRTFDSNHHDDIWKKSYTSHFALSHPVGEFQNKRFVGLNQLGKLISQSPSFYQCEVKRFASLFSQNKLTDGDINNIASQYQDHQNGLTMLSTLLKRIKKDVEVR